jgi:hypothetical protein
MANIGRKFLTDHGVPDEQLDAIMNEINTTISNRMTGYVPQTEVQAQIDAALKAVKQPEPVDPTKTPEYLKLADERDMLRAIGGDDFAQVKPKFRETVYGMLDRGEKAKPIKDQMDEIQKGFEEYFTQAPETTKEQPRNTPQYSKQPGHSGTNPTSEEDKLFKQLSDAWK